MELCAKLTSQPKLTKILDDFREQERQIRKELCRAVARGMCRDYARTVLAKTDILGLHPRERHLTAMDSLKVVIEGDDLELKDDVWPPRIERAGTDETWTVASVPGLDADLAAFKAERRRELATLLGLDADVSEEALVAKADDASTVFRCESHCKDSGLSVSILLEHQCDNVGYDHHVDNVSAVTKPLHDRFNVDTKAVGMIERIFVNASIKPDERYHSKLSDPEYKFILTAAVKTIKLVQAFTTESALEHQRQRQYTDHHPPRMAIFWALVVRAQLLAVLTLQLSAHFSRFASLDGTLVRRIGEQTLTTDRKIRCTACYGERVVVDSDEAILAHEQAVCVPRDHSRADRPQAPAVVQRQPARLRPRRRVAPHDHARLPATLRLNSLIPSLLMPTLPDTLRSIPACARASLARVHALPTLMPTQLRGLASEVDRHRSVECMFACRRSYASTSPSRLCSVGPDSRWSPPVFARSSALPPRLARLCSRLRPS